MIPERANVAMVGVDPVTGRLGSRPRFVLLGGNLRSVHRRAHIVQRFLGHRRRQLHLGLSRLLERLPRSVRVDGRGHAHVGQLRRSCRRPNRIAVFESLRGCPGSHVRLGSALDIQDTHFHRGLRETRTGKQLALCAAATPSCPGRRARCGPFRPQTRRNASPSPPVPRSGRTSDAALSPARPGVRRRPSTLGRDRRCSSTTR